MPLIHHDFTRNTSKKNTIENTQQPIPGYQLCLKLSFSIPVIWRSIQVPGSITLADLHKIIQICFGWQDDATHQFIVGKVFYYPPELCHETSRCENDFQLHELEKGMGFIFSYVYDGGNGWECEISLEDKIPDEKNIPIPKIVAADRAFPPETFDDIHEYQEVLQQLENAENNRDTLLASYNLSKDFDPTRCDYTHLNTMLNSLENEKS